MAKKEKHGSAFNGSQWIRVKLIRKNLSGFTVEVLEDVPGAPAYKKGARFAVGTGEYRQD